MLIGDLVLAVDASEAARIKKLRKCKMIDGWMSVGDEKAINKEILFLRESQGRKKWNQESKCLLIKEQKF